MPGQSHNSFAAPAFASLLAVAAAMLASDGMAQDTDPRLPINLDADSLEYDGKNSMLMYTGLRLTQGNLGIQADQARASQPDFEDSVWQFSGNVVIDVDNGHLESETADLEFSENQLRLAIVTGSPATFEMQRPGTDVVTHAEAGRVRYDFEAGIVEFSENAVITEGCNQISSSYLVYNIKEQRINAQSAGAGDEKVKITYTPRDSVNAEACDRPTPGAPDPASEQDRP